MAKLPVDSNMYIKRRARTMQFVIGQRFTKLVALQHAGHDKHGALLIRCQCDCGNEAIVKQKNLLSEKVKSCGCIRNKMSTNPLERAVLRTLAEQHGIDLDAARQQRHAQRIQFKPDADNN